MPLRCFVWVNNMSIRCPQMKSKGNQTLELENTPQNWKYYEYSRKHTLNRRRGVLRGRRNSLNRGLGRSPINFSFLQPSSYPHNLAMSRVCSSSPGFVRSSEYPMKKFLPAFQAGFKFKD